MTDPLTPAELDAIEARANAASDGPWEVKTMEEWESGFDFFRGESDAFVFPIDAEPEDCQFISASRTDVPRLVAHVRRLTAERDELQRKLDAITTSHRGK